MLAASGGGTLTFQSCALPIELPGLPFCACTLRAAARFPQKAEYNTQVFEGTVIETAHRQSCPRASNVSRCPTKPAGT